MLRYRDLNLSPGQLAHNKKVDKLHPSPPLRHRDPNLSPEDLAHNKKADKKHPSPPLRHRDPNLSPEDLGHSALTRWSEQLGLDTALKTLDSAIY